MCGLTGGRYKISSLNPGEAKGGMATNAVHVSCRDTRLCVIYPILRTYSTTHTEVIYG
jgi:hypothetical protein